ncbi:MAG: hypothetical protein JO250_18905 [Armatimonadetes bacterium]|nr:hypothetical protein [Armatimonadota bacterium]
MTALIQTALILGLLAAAAYGVWEVRRWGTPAGREQVSPRQCRIRAWGLFFLLAALALWLGGTYLPVPHTRRALARYIAYWMLVALAALPLIPLALLDARENLRRAREDRRRLRDAFLPPQDSGRP